MTETMEWRGKVGATWAKEWRRTDRSFAELTEPLLALALETPFSHALDIGCGAGEMTMRLALARPGSRLSAVDIGPELVAIARDRTRHLPQVRVALGDAVDWTSSWDNNPDLLVSRHGVMFFTDPVSAFARLAGKAAPGARMAFSCFRAAAENEWARRLAALFPSGAAQPDPHAPGPFSFGDSGRVSGLLAEAGWQEVVSHPLDYSLIAGEGEGEAALDDATSYFLRVGPAARVLAQLDASAREAAIAGLRDMLAGYRVGGRIALPAAAWLVTARARH